MELTNAVVIYFALGVPFGILSAYLRTSRFEPADMFRVVYHLTFWPLIVAVRAFNEFSAAGIDASAHSVQKNGGERNANRLLRNKLAILEGLKHEHNAAFTATDLQLPFAETIHHPNPALAAKCFQRRNLRRLERQVSKAQREYSESLDRLKSHRPVDDSFPVVEEPQQTSD